MKRHMKNIFFTTAYVLLTVVSVQAQIINSNWALMPFVRPLHKPIISPDSTSEFLDPMSQKKINWEANDTFNPAAAVKGDSIYVLYRAEDKSGVGISERTSRLGLAASAN
jgi:predicted GH43/DUF377 family glycosyl hydrolase